MAIEETIKKREYQHQRHLKHRDEINQRSSQWYYEHREEVLKKHKERMANDPVYAERIRRNQKRADAKRAKKSRRKKL